MLLTLGGIYLALLSRFRILKGFFHAWGLILKKEDNDSEGEVNQLKALTNALSATVGMGNIAGVAAAISTGGAGSLFWMWVVALIGMNTKFFECTLALKYRLKTHEGKWQGGAMYTIVSGLPKAFHPLGIFFALCGLVGTMSIYAVSQLTTYVDKSYQISPWFMAIFLSIILTIVLKGGSKRIGEVTSKLVPFMCFFYIFSCLGIIFYNVENLPGVFTSIFSEAFSGKAAVGGIVGVTIKEVFITGLKRATFSNEAGLGTAPMAHGEAKTKEPIAEGLVSMLGPFLDTIIICTMSGLMILVTLDPSEISSLNGVLLTERAFNKVYGELGTHLLAIAVILFAISSVIGMSNYNIKCWGFLFGKRKILGHKNTFIMFYITSVIIGALASPKDVLNLMDIAIALMAFPNMFATIFLAKGVIEDLKNYFVKHKI